MLSPTHCPWSLILFPWQVLGGTDQLAQSRQQGREGGTGCKDSVSVSWLAAVDLSAIAITMGFLASFHHIKSITKIRSNGYSTNILP